MSQNYKHQNHFSIPTPVPREKLSEEEQKRLNDIYYGIETVHEKDLPPIRTRPTNHRQQNKK